MSIGTGSMPFNHIMYTPGANGSDVPHVTFAKRFHLLWTLTHPLGTNHTSKPSTFSFPFLAFTETTTRASHPFGLSLQCAALILKSCSTICKSGDTSFSGVLLSKTFLRRDTFCSKLSRYVAGVATQHAFCHCSERKSECVFICSSNAPNC